MKNQKPKNKKNKPGPKKNLPKKVQVVVRAANAPSAAVAKRSPLTGPNELASFLARYSDGLFRFYRSLVHPESGAARVPGMIPIPTAVVQYKQTGTSSIAAAGSCMRLILSPLFYGSAYGTLATVTGASADVNETTGVGSSTVVTVNFQLPITGIASQWRCTGASLKITGISSNTTSTGYHTLSFVPVAYSGASNTDYFRDFDTTVKGRWNRALTMTWRPLDYNDMNFVSNANNRSSLVYCASGFAVGQTIQWDLVVNYEYIPLSGYTDVVDLVAGPAGGFDESVVSALSTSSAMKMNPSALSNKLERTWYQHVWDGLSSGVGSFANRYGDKLISSLAGLATI